MMKKVFTMISGEAIIQQTEPIMMARAVTGMAADITETDPEVHQAEAPQEAVPQEVVRHQVEVLPVETLLELPLKAEVVLQAADPPQVEEIQVPMMTVI